MLRFAIVGLLALLSAAGARADVELLLLDGQVLRGIDVTRVDDSYLIEIEPGKVIPVPVELVARMRLAIDGREEDPSDGLTRAGPEELGGPATPEPRLRPTGPEVVAGPAEPPPPPTRAEQLEVLDEPSRFRADLVDPRWTPSSDWSNDPAGNQFAPSRWARGPLDPWWLPENGLGDGDVLEPGESRWRPSIIDPEWFPTDGFDTPNNWRRALQAERRAREREELTALTRATLSERLRASLARDCELCDVSEAAIEPAPRFRVFSGRSTSSSAPPRSAWTSVSDCAEAIFAAAVDPEAAAELGPARALDGQRWDLIPLELHAARGRAQGRDLLAVFTADGDACRLVSGDVDALLGVELGEEHAVARDVTAFNAALADAGGVRLDDDRERLDYAVAVAELLDPAAIGDGVPLVLLDKRSDLARLAGERTRSCSLGSRSRRREARDAQDAFQPPAVTPGVDENLVSFTAWRHAGGLVVRHDVLIGGDGRVSIHRETLGRHLGDHECGPGG